MPTPDLVAPNAIIPALKVNGKKQALQEIAAKAAALTGQSDRAILEILLQREKLGSTGVGNGVAIPHGKARSADHMMAACAVSPEGLDFDAEDGQPATLFVLFVSPEHAATLHVKVLANISRLLKEESVRKSLREARSPEDFLAAVQNAEAAFIPTSS